MRRFLIVGLVVSCIGCHVPQVDPSATTSARRTPAPAEPSEAPVRDRDVCIPNEVMHHATHCAARIPGTTREEVEKALHEVDREIAERPPKPVPPPGSAAPLRGQERRERERAELAEKQPYPAERVALSVLTSYVCEHERDVEAVDRLAHLHFELNHFAEAALRFGQVVLHGHPEDPRVVAAFLLQLEALNVLGDYFSRTTCFDDMEERLPYASRHLCAFELLERQPERAAKCALIRRVEADVERLHERPRVRKGEGRRVLD